MSLHISFEPHSWYQGVAIEDCRGEGNGAGGFVARWYGVTANGMTGYLVEFEADTLTELKQQIKDYRRGL